MHVCQAVLLLLVPSTTFAQGVDVIRQRPPIEIGVGFAHLEMADIDISLYGAWSSPELRLTIPWSPRFAIEVSSMMSQRHYTTLYYDVTGERPVRSTHLEGLYTIQVKHQLGRAAGERFHAFATYGGSGYYDFITDAPETTYQHSDGRVDRIRAGNPRNIPPIATTVGVGLQHRLSRHLALRAEAQLIAALVLPFGYRASASIAIRLGADPRFER